MGLTSLDDWRCFTTAYGGQCVTIDSALLRLAWCVVCSTTPELSALWLMQGLGKAEVCRVCDYCPCCPPDPASSNTSIPSLTWSYLRSALVFSASSPLYSTFLYSPPPLSLSLPPPSSLSLSHLPLPSPSLPSSSYSSHPCPPSSPSRSNLDGWCWLFSRTWGARSMQFQGLGCS